MKSNKTVITKEQIIKSLQEEASTTYGPNANVVRAMESVIESDFQLIESNNQVKKSIDNFSKSTRKSEKYVTRMTWLAIGIATVQLIVALIK